MAAENVVVSICHPGKFGLVDHAEALVHYGQRLDPQRTYVLAQGLDEVFAVARRIRRTGNKAVCVVWDNSLATFASAVLAKQLGLTFVYYYHEPGGIGQKLFKADPLLYSLKSSLGEWLMCQLADRRAVARPDKLCFGDLYFPLLFDDQRPPWNSRKRVIGFLGARRNQRFFDLFQQMAPSFAAAGFEVAYFPSPESGRSREEKFAFLANCTAIWNVYGVSFNQSGVTGDCFMSSTPVIASHFEPYRELLALHGKLVEVDLFQEPKDMCARLVANLERLVQARPGQDPESLRQAQSAFGGAAAFSNHWLPVLGRLLDG